MYTLEELRHLIPGERVIYLLTDRNVQEVARSRFGRDLSDGELEIVGMCVYMEPLWRDVVGDVIEKHVIRGEGVPNRRRDIG